MSLESLLASHRQTLTTLYTTLSPSPLPLLNAQLDALHAQLESTITAQRIEAEAEVASVEQRVSESWRKVADWRTALGESEGVGRGVGPLLVLVQEVDTVLGGMRSRMEERGNLIVGLQERLGKLSEVLGKEWMVVKLEDVSAGWEGLDLRLERMSCLEREVMRCDAEIVSHSPYQEVQGS